MSDNAPILRVAIVANSIWNLHNFRRGVIKAVAVAGHEIFLVAPPDGAEESLGKLPGTFLPLRHLNRHGTQPLQELLLVRELYLLYRKHRFDRVLHFTAKPVIYGSLAARWVGIKSIATLTGLGYTFLRDRFTATLMKRLYAFALSRTETVFYHNPDDRALLLSAGVGAADRSFVVGGSGLPLNEFPLQSYDLAIPGRFLFVGRLLSDKGIREFVAAAGIIRKKHPKLSFHIVGEQDLGNPTSISQEELDGWGVAGDVTFHGQVDDVRPHLTEASVVVLPSCREGCPRSLLEAAATGRALIGTDVPGVREVVVAEINGWLVPAKSSIELALSMKWAAENGALRKMGVEGRMLVEEKFSEDRIAGKYLTRLLE